ncbi:hypothetical protein [Streptomyces sp. NPDC051636]|uniref:hypothetical protein n=1 Tax=Streptomyces sp. NPDC051636 TaxID=3365663 RepID=UPI0037A0AE1D
MPHRVTAAGVEYVFDDSITALTQHEAGATVGFERGTTREFGLVAVYMFSGADAGRLAVTPLLPDRLARAGPARPERAGGGGAGRVRAAGGREVPRLLASDGRVALAGDAGYCAAPTSGVGTSQALIGARSLARHLAEAGGDHATAFAGYGAGLRPYVAENQATGREGAVAFGGRVE